MDQYAKARKEYVENARRSFGDSIEDDYGDEPAAGSSAFLKVRLMISVCIFAAFVLCDRTGSRFYDYTTTEIRALIEDNRFGAQLDSVREVWSSLTDHDQ